MDIKLVDTKPELTAAWSYFFVDFPEVEIIAGRFEEIGRFDCVVSPGNSYGIMDGGFDLALCRYFGPQLMPRVQETIRREFFGEQPVGTAVVVETGDSKHPFLAHAPTMRIPTDIQGTDNCYRAIAAVLREVALFNRDHGDCIASVLCPGLGAAVSGGQESPRWTRAMR